MVIKDMSYMFPVYPIFCCITVLLSVAPIIIHWRLGNIAIVSVSMWTGIALIILGVNATVWHGNLRNPYPIWGDIVQVYFSMLPVALSSCNLWIQYRLWKVASARTVFVTKGRKRRDKLLACFFCFGIPAIVGALHSIVQGHRYNVWEDIGPFTETYNVTLAFPIYYMWESLLCFISGLFAIHTAALLLARRKELDIALNSGSTNINKSRYMRLVWLAFTATFIHFPLTLWLLIVNLLAYRIYPWISWEDTHSNFHRIAYFTRFYISQTNWAIYTSISWWSVVLCGLLVFVFFGTGEEAAREYRSWLRIIYRLFGKELPKKRQEGTMKRSWLDIILRRPGSARNADPQSTNGDIPAFATITIGTISSVDALESSEVLNNKEGTADPATSSSSLPPPPKQENDVEAQQPSALTIEQERRREILEKNPELTEEVCF